ncbi:hypothetical protein KVR01_008280 [Diaporthe batatas]|uniref:uncharacterized protein n=1 Tax=Diaporthe batatas TaxID=748121 RepID=UPI001D04B90A|nr:uncharacterized protein KVR01_008280 [Diaporthe batatas]KAG8162515.1 hypothetical protein KVR01_008280 [Diaporthe batatas]
MLPPSLVSVYHQYKEDTNALAAWLASTAKSRGYGAPKATPSYTITTTTAGSQTSKRLKGKARKDAKAAFQQAHVSSAESSGPEYVITINDFVPLAKFIAGCKKPAISVPRSFTNTLNRVIAMRSGFSKKLAKIRDHTDASNDSSHAYFVGILEEVHEVLKPRVRPSTPNPPIFSSSTDPVGEVGGKFAGLSVEDPSEAFLNAPDIERPTPAENDKATYKAEPQQELAEIMFAYDLLLKDLNQIRIRIASILIKYKEDYSKLAENTVHRVDLATAAIATNTACDLARNLIEEMSPIFKPHGGLIEIAKQFDLDKCLDLGFSGPCLSRDKTDLICETYALADQTCMVSIFILENHKRIKPDEIVVLRDRQFDTYDQSAEWASISNYEKFRNDCMVMWEMSCELRIMFAKFPDLLVDDEFVRGMRERQRSGEVSTSMSLVFAAQVFLDIHDHLRDTMDNDLQLHLDFIREGYTKGFGYLQHESLMAYRAEIKFVQSDPIHRFKVELSAREGLPPCPRSNLAILKYSPVVSGLFLFRMKQQIYKTGLNLANLNAGLLNPMQLYNALRQENLLSTQEAPSGCWQDMELLCRLVGEESFFVGARPRQHKEYMKNLLLQTGMSVAALSTCKSRKHTSRHVKSKKGVRLIKTDLTPVMDMLVDRYVEKKGQFDWTTQDVEGIISRSIYFQNQGRHSKQNRASKANGPQMTPEKLIESLVIALHTETLTQVFPYLTLQRSASGRPGDESELPGIVYLILSKLGKGDGRLFTKAGEAVKEQLRKGNGHKAIHRLSDMGYVVTARRGDKFEIVYNPDTGTINLDVDADVKLAPN